MRSRPRLPRDRHICEANTYTFVMAFYIYRNTATKFLNSYLNELQEARISSFWIGSTGNIIICPYNQRSEYKR